MKIIQAGSIILILIFLIDICYSQEKVTSKKPEHVILNVTENPSESIAVTWRTKENIIQFVQWAKATGSPVIPAENQQKKAKSEMITFMDGDLEPVTFTYHSSIIEGLLPNSKYLYRVGDESVWSEWLEFKTAGSETEPFSFLYFGDAQNDIKSHWSRVIRKAYSIAPEAGFIYHAGDLINRSNSEQEWNEWFYAGSFIHAYLPAFVTPGNHEYGRDMILDQHWRPQFTLPENGPEMELLKETTFFVDYQNLRIISLDADLMDENEEAAKKSMEWLDKILNENTKQWTILTLHYPFYSTKDNRDNDVLRNRFQPIIEKYKVDMVLAGHDHAYGRGMKNIMSMTKEGEVSGPMYVVSVSGPKQYDVSEKSWMTRKAGNTQLFQVISIDGNKLNYKAYTAIGELYDEFNLIKRKGKLNKLINRIPDAPERSFKRSFN